MRAVNSLRFSMTIENDLVFVSVIDIDLVPVPGIELDFSLDISIDLFCEWGSKMTWVSYLDGN